MSWSSAPRRRRRDAPVRKKRAIRWAALILPSFALVAVIALVWMAATAMRMLSPAGEPVAVPSFVGMAYADAQDAAAAAHLSLHVVARKPDYHARKGEIVGQLPAPGEHVRTGRVIDVVLSDGEPLARVPNVANMSVRDATVALENARLDVGKVTSRYDGSVPEATVLEQQPEALSQVPAGMKVDLVVAKGQPVAYAPNFVGMPASSVAAAAQEARVALLPLVQMPIAPSAPPEGIVVSQDPPAGEQLKPGEKITLQVSGGALPTSAPPFEPSPLSGPSSAPAAATAVQSPPVPGTPTPRGIRISVAVPQSDTPVRIRVVVVDANGSRTLFDQLSRGGMTLSFDIAVTGAAMLQTYIGDTLVNSTPL